MKPFLNKLISSLVFFARPRLGWLIVALLVGLGQQSERELRRAQVKASVLGGDYAPRRARFAEDPAPLALAMSLAVREVSRLVSMR